VSGTTPIAEGITNPPIDELLTKTDSKYRLVLYAAKRARQINAYYSQLGEGLLEYVGPLVDTHVQEKPLSIALREINEDLLTHTEFDPEAESAAAALGDGTPASDFAVDFGLSLDDQDGGDGAGPDGSPAP
jgi:DNA-directed RNA polymerase subunit omega